MSVLKKNANNNSAGPENRTEKASGVKAWLENEPLLFDGAMQTLLAAKLHTLPSPSEALSLENPDVIRQVHREYIDAGAKAIKTHTFGISSLLEQNDPQWKELLRAGAGIGKEFEDCAFVFADIGPAFVDAQNTYIKQAEEFLALGFENFLFETGQSLEGIQTAAEFIKEKNPDAFILVSFAASEDGLTQTGESVSDLLKACDEIDAIDAAGLNCRLGPHHMRMLAQSLPPLHKPLSLMPNAGYPAILGRNVVYDSAPEYFALQCVKLFELGASIGGGCCGTTPQHIQLLSQKMKNAGFHPAFRTEKSKKHSAMLLEQPEFPVAVELQPPADDSLAPFLENAKRIRNAGADWITLADCPVGRSRSDSALMSVLLQQQLGITPLPHLTCRDRNVNATKALLLGLSMAKVHQVLLVTGDPIPAQDRSEVKSVYNFNSRKLISFVRNLNEEVLKTPFAIYAALNLNVPNFDKQLELAKEKEKAGAIGFLTQPVLSENGLKNLQKAKRELSGKILGGIFPVVSRKNAEYLHHEVFGMDVAPEIRDAYEGLDRAEGQNLAVKLSKAVMNNMRPYVDGFYLITPFTRTELMVPIIEHARTLAGTPEISASWNDVTGICKEQILKRQ